MAEGERGGLGLPEAGGGSVVVNLLQQGTPHRSDQRSNQREREREKELWGHQRPKGVWLLLRRHNIQTRSEN